MLPPYVFSSNIEWDSGRTVRTEAAERQGNGQEGQPPNLNAGMEQDCYFIGRA